MVVSFLHPINALAGIFFIFLLSSTVLSFLQFMNTLEGSVLTFVAFLKLNFLSLAEFLKAPDVIL